MSPPLSLTLYRLSTGLAAPLALPVLRARAARGKEDPARLGERFGRASAVRPTGPLVWLHGASVGETRVGLEVRAALTALNPDLSFLFTTMTRTAASLFNAPPPRTLHQFGPLDLPQAARRFIAFWRPDLAIFAESDVWPNLLFEARRSGAKLALINARISPRSLASWARRPSSAKSVFGLFDAVVAADTLTAEGLEALLGRTIPSPGNLKLAAAAPKVDDRALFDLRGAIGARRVWLAASTHPGEDEIAIAAHALVREQWPDSLLIIAPRHPERGPAIAALAKAPRRAGAGSISESTLYVADTMGELGLFYAVSDAALIGGSLLPHLKGHNPVEPAKLGCPIITGPHVESFAEAYDLLFAANGALQATDAESLAAAVDSLFRNPDKSAALAEAARASTSAGAHAMEMTIRALKPLAPDAVRASA